MNFSIAPLDTSLAPTLQHKIDNKTKPLGSLGRLETLALQIGLIQQDLYPVLRQPQMLIFAGDHGAAAEGVSLYPQAVTQQMVLNFVQGGAAINAFCAQNGLGLTIIDAGVNADFAADMPLVHAKIAKGTANYCSAAAMSAEQFEEALAAGAAVVEQKFQTGCNCVGLGEMGIGNTASASLIAHQLTGLPLSELVGRGTGLDDAGLAHKTATLQRAMDFHALTAPDPAAVLRTFGGFEIVMLVGAMLRAAERQMLILVDGFIATAAALAALKMHSNALAYCVFCHASFELGHKTLLRYLGAEPLLQLDMRLGEGSGAALAYPLVAAAVTFLNSMASFDNAGVSRAI